MNSDWAKNLAERKKSELEAKRLQQEKDLNDRKLLDSNADKMWVEVRRAAAGCCKELNSSMGSDYIKFEGASYHNSFTLITPEATLYGDIQPSDLAAIRPGNHIHVGHC